MTSLQRLNEFFHIKARLGIMTILITQSECDFINFKKLLGLTDGNLGAHLRVLEEVGYLVIKKGFVGRRPHTTCHITDQGREAFIMDLELLEEIVQVAKSRNLKNDL